MYREAIRYFSASLDYEVWMLSDSEVKFFNTIYAFVAVILGISAAINFLIDRPIGLSAYSDSVDPLVPLI